MTTSDPVRQHVRMISTIDRPRVLERGLEDQLRFYPHDVTIEQLQQQILIAEAELFCIVVLCIAADNAAASALVLSTLARLDAADISHPRVAVSGWAADTWENGRQGYLGRMRHALQLP